MTTVKNVWKAAIAFDATTVASFLRECLEELKFDFSRENIEKRYSKIAFVLPLPKSAYVFRFSIKTPSPFTIDAYDMAPNHGGILHILEVREIDENNINDVRTILAKLTGKLPRKPWEFNWSERLRTGALLPEFMRAKKRWREFGIL
ncbi:MAG: hypothetical protein WC974_07730 [Thermoplasmata archaeon]